MEDRSANEGSANILAEERRFFEGVLDSLLKEHSGAFVLIKGTTIIGFYRSSGEAYQEGRKQFGYAPFLVNCVDRSLKAEAA
jgi:hypothetical protein